MDDTKYALLMFIVMLVAIGATYYISHFDEPHSKEESQEERINIPPAVPVPSKAEIIGSVNPNLSREEITEIYIGTVSAVNHYRRTMTGGAASEITPELVLAVIHTESTFNKDCHGSSGEIGLMQIIPHFHRTELKKQGIIKKDRDLWSTETNILAGTYILFQYAVNSKNITEALSRYNTGQNCKLGHSYAKRVYARRRTYLG